MPVRFWPSSAASIARSSISRHRRLLPFVVAARRSRRAGSGRRRIAGAQTLADFGYECTKDSRLDRLTALEPLGDQPLQLMVQELSQHGRLIRDGQRKGILERQWPLPTVGVTRDAEREYRRFRW